MEQHAPKTLTALGKAQLLSYHSASLLRQNPPTRQVCLLFRLRHFYVLAYRRKSLLRMPAPELGASHDDADHRQAVFSPDGLSTQENPGHAQHTRHLRHQARSFAPPGLPPRGREAGEAAGDRGARLGRESSEAHAENWHRGHALEEVLDPHAFPRGALGTPGLRSVAICWRRRTSRKTTMVVWLPFGFPT